MNKSIKNKQNKATLLAPQDEALDFYFDSLLLTDENDIDVSEELTIEQRIEPQVVIEEPQAVIEKPQPTIKKIQPLMRRSQPLIEKAAEENKLVLPCVKKTIGGSSIDETNSCYIPNKLISKGPVSAKPGEAKLSTIEKIMKKSESISSEIIFSEKDKEGKDVNHVLTPRSHRPINLPSVKIMQQKKNKPSEQKSIDIKEAPELDLSFFLPGIKTLSNEEIKQSLQQDDSNAVSGKSPDAPAWAETDFQVLLFTLSGLKLAVPLNELNCILQWGDEYINELPGHASWYLGLIRNQGVNIPVVDTLQQVVPEQRWPENYIRQRKFEHIIVIDNNRLGLACEKVLEVITIKTDTVKWRSSRTKRRWLSGTVIEHMCALLDSSEFSAMLKTGDDSMLNKQ